MAQPIDPEQVPVALASALNHEWRRTQLNKYVEFQADIAHATPEQEFEQWAWPVNDIHGVPKSGLRRQSQKECREQESLENY